jgi:hypothetical protein
MLMLEGMNWENLAKWTCVDVCVVWWWIECDSVSSMSI